MRLNLRWLYPTAFWCLLLSGVAGLVYQVVWARYLALLLGSTSYGVVAVLVAFMGGLALGNAWLGRYADRLRRPLALYGWLEIGIAAYGIFFPQYFELCQAGYRAIAAGIEPTHPSLLALKFVFGLAVILVPATLMGGTLPILTRLVTRSLGELRGRVAGLYFVNSLGAVVGVLAADFWWIPSFGLEVSILGAASLNALVGVLALFVQSGLREAATPAASEPSPTVESTPAQEGDEPKFAPFEWRLAVVAAGISGFVAMLYEVVWTRLLALTLGSSTHAFSIMLATFIAGIAAGAWVVGRWRGLKRTFDAFGWVELALALVLLGSMFFYHLLPYGFYRLGDILARRPENHGVYQLLQFLVCFGVMFGPALCLGMTLPLATRVATAEVAKTGRSVGLVFSVNTIGTVLGAALSGLVFLPYLGLAATFALGLALNLAIALAVLLRHASRLRSAMVVGLPMLIAACVGFAAVVLDPKWDRAFALGLWRYRGPVIDLDAYLNRVRTLNLRYHRDGAGSTVAVASGVRGTNQVEQFDLRVNGKTDASSHGDLPTQLLSGHIPMLLHPQATEALVVGIGSGITCGAVLTHPGVSRLDVVEISPEVHHAAREWFRPFNQGALEDPRTQVIIDDAKSFLGTTQRQYDVIVTEPSNPWMAGVSGVFSLEYYETCRDSLKPGGLIAQWVQVYETDDTAIRTVLATFGSVFPHFSIWQTLQGDLLLVGSMTPTDKDVGRIQRQFERPEVRKDIERADVFTFAALLGLQVISEENGAHLVADDTPRHSDFFPRLEYIAERAFFARGETRYLAEFDERQFRRPSTLLARHLEKQPFTPQDARAIVLLSESSDVPPPEMVRSALRQWMILAPQDLLPIEISAKFEYALPVAEAHVQEMAKARSILFEQAPREPEPLRMYSRYLQNVYRNARSVLHQPPAEELHAVLEHLAETDAVHKTSHLLRLAELAWDLGHDDRFAALVSTALLHTGTESMVGRFDFDYSAPGRILSQMIEALWRRGSLRDAVWWCEQAKRGGFLDDKSRYHNPRLAMVVRKVELHAKNSKAGRP